MSGRCLSSPDGAHVPRITGRPRVYCSECGLLLSSAAVPHGACGRCGCAREECECRSRSERDREILERRGYPRSVDYEALIVAEDDDD